MKLYHSSNVIVDIQYCIRTERMLRECLTYINCEQI